MEREFGITTAGSEAPVRFEGWPEVARIETDRFCHACGYNLHEQSVRREPQTQVLMCRCPECGTFHPVGSPYASWSKWKQRLKGLLVLSWIANVLNFAFWVGFLHGISIYFTLDEFTGYYDQQLRTFIQELKPWYQEQAYYWWLVCLISGSSCFGLAFVGTTLAVVFLPHWKMAAQRIVIYIWAVLPAIVVGLLFREEAPKLFRWSLPFIGAYIGCYLGGAFLALLIGRGLMRLVVRICVPPKWRVYLEAIRPQ